MKARNIFKNQNFFNALFLLVIFCAIFIRFYRLASAPAGYFFDEIVVGINSFHFANFLQDEFGNHLPDFIKIADDYRHPAIFYATAPFIKVLGLNIMAVRMTTALFGTLIVIAVFPLSYLITKNKKIALISMALAAISPWLVNISRSSNEIIFALFFLILASISFLLSRSGKKIFFVLMYLALVLAWFSYSAAILLTFLHAAFFTASALFSKSTKQIKIMTLGVLLALIIFPNLFYIITNPKKITGRFDTISVFALGKPQLVLEEQLRDDGLSHLPISLSRAHHNKLISYFSEISQNYSSYFSGAFLLGQEGGPQRYRIPGAGLLYYLDIPLFLIGIFFIFRKLDAKKSLMVFWLFTGAIPASLTVEDIPNIQRAIFMNPAWQIITAFGVYSIFTLTYKSRAFSKWHKAFIPILLLGYFYFSTSFFHQLIYHQPTHQNWYRDSEWQSTAQTVQENEKLYKKLNLYSTIGHYFLFFYSTDYRETYLEDKQLRKQYLENRDLWGDWSMGKYYFRHEKCLDKQLIEKDTLYSVGQNCPVPSWARIVSTAKTTDGVAMHTLFDAPYTDVEIQQLIQRDEDLSKIQ